MKQVRDTNELDWLHRCKNKGCHERKVKCPRCGHPAHKVPHKGPKIGIAKMVCVHGHYVEQQDAGRNNFHYTGETKKLNKKEYVLTWRIKRRRIVN